MGDDSVLEVFAIPLPSERHAGALSRIAGGPSRSLFIATSTACDRVSAGPDGGGMAGRRSLDSSAGVLGLAATSGASGMEPARRIRL